MFKPRFATSHTLVPILSKDAINDIGEKLVEDFCPQAMTTPTEIDVDRFITRYLGLEQDFQYLSHCGVFLGMTVFNDTDRVPVFNPDRWEAKYIPVKAGTVIIDNILLEENQEHRFASLVVMKLRIVSFMQNTSRRRLRKHSSVTTEFRWCSAAAARLSTERVVEQKRILIGLNGRQTSWHQQS